MSNETPKQVFENKENYKNEVIDNNNQINTETETEEDEQVIEHNTNAPIKRSPTNSRSEINNPSPLKRLTPNENKQDEISHKKQIKKELKDPMQNLKDGTDIPDKYLSLKWV